MRYFKIEEFECPCCGVTKVEQSLLDKLDQLRFEVKRPLKINSGYRCQDHNKAVGGAKTSQHLIGLAADISTRGFTAEEVYHLLEWCFILQFRGIGVYKSFIHVDLRFGVESCWRR